MHAPPRPLQSRDCHPPPANAGRAERPSSGWPTAEKISRLISNVCLHLCSRRARVRSPTSPPLIDHSDWRIVMSPPDPDAVYAVLREADPEVMDRDQLAGLASLVRSHRAWLDSVQVRIIRRQRSLADEG